MVNGKYMSSSLSKKCSRSGIGVPQLKIIHVRDAENGIKMLFNEPVGARNVRITRSAPTVKKVVAFFSDP